jgi:hypothetical protein
MVARRFCCLSLTSTDNEILALSNQEVSQLYARAGTQLSGVSSPASMTSPAPHLPPASSQMSSQLPNSNPKLRRSVAKWSKDDSGVFA